MRTGDLWDKSIFLEEYQGFWIYCDFGINLLVRLNELHEITGTLSFIDGYIVVSGLYDII